MTAEPPATAPGDDEAGAPAEPRMAPAAVPGPLPAVVYEDDALIAFDKPSGMLVAPGGVEDEAPDLMTRLHAQCSPEWFNAHRLDRDSSGVLLVAKSRDIVRVLTKIWSSGEVRKAYRALVHGAPADNEGVMRARIAPDRRRPGRMRVASYADSGKPAETHYRILQRWRRHSLVAAEPITGRTHQIRVHLHALGAPIVADPLYGPHTPLLLSDLKRGYKFKRDEPERPLMGRLALHALTLTLPHPVTGERLTIEAPLPRAFAVSIKYLDRYEALGASSAGPT